VQLRRGLVRRQHDGTRHLLLDRREEVRGVRVYEKAQCGGACVMTGRGSRACTTKGRGQVVLVRDGVCVRTSEFVEEGW
jgi:hypothetical protein